jgi:hypothetical protein
MILSAENNWCRPLRRCNAVPISVPDVAHGPSLALLSGKT